MTTVGKRPDAVRYAAANRISVMTDIPKESFMESSILLIDAPFAQRPYQATKIYHLNRLLINISRCSKYFLSRLCGFSSWNNLSPESKIHTFLYSLLTNKADISIVTETWINC